MSLILTTSSDHRIHYNNSEMALSSFGIQHEFQQLLHSCHIIKNQLQAKVTRVSCTFWSPDRSDCLRSAVTLNLWDVQRPALILLRRWLERGRTCLIKLPPRLPSELQNKATLCSRGFTGNQRAAALSPPPDQVPPPEAGPCPAPNDCHVINLRDTMTSATPADVSVAH